MRKGDGLSSAIECGEDVGRLLRALLANEVFVLFPLVNGIRYKHRATTAAARYIMHRRHCSWAISPRVSRGIADNPAAMLPNSTNNK